MMLVSCDRYVDNDDNQTNADSANVCYRRNGLQCADRMQRRYRRMTLLYC